MFQKGVFVLILNAKMLFRVGNKGNSFELANKYQKYTGLPFLMGNAWKKSIIANISIQLTYVRP